MWRAIEQLLGRGKRAEAAEVAAALIAGPDAARVPADGFMQLGWDCARAGDGPALKPLMRQRPPRVTEDLWDLLRAAAALPGHLPGKARRVLVDAIAEKDVATIEKELRELERLSPALAVQVARALRKAKALVTVSMTTDNRPRPKLVAIGAASFITILLVVAATMFLVPSRDPIPEPQGAPKPKDLWPAADEICRHREDQRGCAVAVEAQRALNGRDCAAARVAIGNLPGSLVQPLSDDEAESVKRLQKRYGRNCPEP
ncbi:MAG: hypothetical protein ACYC8T_17915 [Myxococcaceae bacterium]